MQNPSKSLIKTARLIALGITLAGSITLSTSANEGLVKPFDPKMFAYPDLSEQKPSLVHSEYSPIPRQEKTESTENQKPKTSGKIVWFTPATIEKKTNTSPSHRASGSRACNTRKPTTLKPHHPST